MPSKSSKRGAIVRVQSILLSVVLGSIMNVAGALSQERFQFGLIGDMPYTGVQQQEYERVLAALNKAELSFVVHVGDFQNDPRGYYPNPAIGPEPCTDERYRAVYDSFQSVRHPVVLTPGDNDWADCHLIRDRPV